MNMFTQGQAARMLSSLNNIRTSILSSTGHAPVVANDVGVTGLTIQPGIFCSDSIIPAIEISNFGTATLNTVTIKCTTGNGATSETTWTGSLETHQSNVVQLNAIAVSEGTDTLIIYTTSPNGNTDGVTGNDTLKKSIEVEAHVAKTLPFSESFEGNFLPPKGWEIINHDFDRSWTYKNNVEGPDGNTSKAIFIEYYIYKQLTEADELITPSIDLANASQPELSFDIAYARKPTTTNYDSLIIYGTTDCYHYSRIAAKGGTELTNTTEQPGSGTSVVMNGKK